MRQLTQTRPQIGVVQVGIMLFTIATAAIHFYLSSQPDEDLRVLFFFNGLGYLALLAALYVPQLARFHAIVRWLLIVYTAVTIVSWLIVGQPYDTLGFVTKAIEIILIALLFVEMRQRANHNI